LVNPGADRGQAADAGRCISKARWSKNEEVKCGLAASVAFALGVIGVGIDLPESETEEYHEFDTLFTA
jgi:hypothetical protein